MKKGVIYARYSCDKQTDNSTKAQIRECTEWAKKNNIQIIDTYVDEAISGRTDKRPAFQKMIADAERGWSSRRAISPNMSPFLRIARVTSVPSTTFEIFTRPS